MVEFHMEGGSCEARRVEPMPTEPADAVFDLGPETRALSTSVGRLLVRYTARRRWWWPFKRVATQWLDAPGEYVFRDGKWRRT